LDGVKLAYYANAQLALDKRDWQQYSRSGFTWDVLWRGGAVMAGLKIHAMFMGEPDGNPKNPSPTAPVDLIRTSKVRL
jgi:hypothetical protein